MERSISCPYFVATPRAVAPQPLVWGEGAKYGNYSNQVISGREVFLMDFHSHGKYVVDLFENGFTSEIGEHEKETWE